MATVVGTVAGWSGALVIATLAVGNRINDETALQCMLLSLSMALISSAALLLQKHQRPLGAAFEMGYSMGRRDAIREASGRRPQKVTPIRRGADGSSAYEGTGA